LNEKLPGYKGEALKALERLEAEVGDFLRVEKNGDPSLPLRLQAKDSTCQE